LPPSSDASLNTLQTSATISRVTLWRVNFDLSNHLGFASGTQAPLGETKAGRVMQFALRYVF